MAQRLHGIFKVKAEGRARLIVFDTQDLSLGRAPDNDLDFDDPEMSRHHAVFERSGGACRIRDLGTPNGTGVNGEAVEQAPLRSGDVVRVGQVEIAFAETPRDPASLGATVEYASQLKSFEGPSAPRGGGEVTLLGMELPGASAGEGEPGEFDAAFDLLELPQGEESELSEASLPGAAELSAEELPTPDSDPSDTVWELEDEVSAPDLEVSAQPPGTGALSLRIELEGLDGELRRTLEGLAGKPIELGTPAHPGGEGLGGKEADSPSRPTRREAKPSEVRAPARQGGRLTESADAPRGEAERRARASSAAAAGPRSGARAARCGPPTTPSGRRAGTSRSAMWRRAPGCPRCCDPGRSWSISLLPKTASGERAAISRATSSTPATRASGSGKTRFTRPTEKRLLGGQAPPGEGQLPGDSFRDEPGQSGEGAQVGGDAQLDLLDAEEGLLAAVAQVAGADQIDAAADAGALDGRQHRHARPLQTAQALLQLQDRAAQVCAAPPELGVGVGIGDGAAEHRQVHAGAEVPARGGEHQGPHLTAGVELADDLRQARSRTPGSSSCGRRRG